jgi:hypothetical protein
MDDPNLTYRELLRVLLNMPPDRLDDNVSVHVRGVGEFYTVQDYKLSSDDNDVLDSGHLYLEI